jgi:hypothetical protein
VREQEEAAAREEEERRRAEEAERALSEAIAQRRTAAAREKAEQQRDKADKSRTGPAGREAPAAPGARARAAPGDGGARGGAAARQQDERRDPLGEAARLVGAGQHEAAVQAIARALAQQGARALPPAEARELIAQQRASTLACVRRGASHSFALSLPNALAQGRGKRQEPEDEVRPPPSSETAVSRAWRLKLCARGAGAGATCAR